MIAFDTETYLVANGQQAPKAVCLQYCKEDKEPHIHIGKEITANFTELINQATAENPLIGQNTAYDTTVMAAHDIALMPLIFNAYEQGAIQCTRLRERLIDIARGETGPQTRQRGYYSMDSIAMRHGIQTKVDKSNPWRLKFAELENVPIKDWPKEAYEYAATDPIVTLEIYQAQAATVRDHLDYLYSDPKEFEAEAARQASYDFALRLMSCWGVRTDEYKIKKLFELVDGKLSELTPYLIERGIMIKKPNGKLSKKLSVIRTKVKNYFEAQGMEVPMTDKGGIKTSKEVLEKCEDTALEAVVEHSYYTKMRSTYATKLIEGINGNIHASFHTLGADTGRSSSSNPNLQNQSKKGGIRECFIPRKGCVFVGADYDAQELRTLAQVCLDICGYSSLAEKFKENPDFDPHTAFAATLMGWDYNEALKKKETGDKTVKEWRQRAKACFHPDTEILTKEKGWLKIADLTEEIEVAAAYPQRNGNTVINWEKPYALTRRKAPDNQLVHLKNKSIDLRVTKDHRMVGFRPGSGDPFVTTPDKINNARYLAGAGVISQGEFPGGYRQWDLLRLAIATQADGSYQRSRITFGFSKARKIQRLTKLLERIDSPSDWSIKTNKRGTQTFAIEKPLADKIKTLLDKDKTLPLWYIKLPQELRNIILDESMFWNSHKHENNRRLFYRSTIKKNVDVLQAVAATLGKKSTIKKEKQCYKLSVADHSAIPGGNIETMAIENYTDDVVCLSVPSSFVLVRDKGTPVIVGQCNFGFPGGLGAESFKSYAKNYGAILTEDEAEKLRDDWFKQWPEMVDFFRRVQDVASIGYLKQIRSGRMRGGVSFCDGANSFFQGLASDASKTASWFIAKACFVDEDSPLFGCRPLMLVHDEVIVEAPESYAHEAAQELERLMVKAMAMWCPDVPARATPAISRRWSKDVEPVFDKQTGRLIPWEDRA